MLPGMSKRQLSRRQQWRIDKIQQERLARAARRTTAADVDQTGELASERPGQVIAHFGQQLLVADATGQAARCHFRANLEQLVVGDQVLFAPPLGDGCGVITAMQPRQTVLQRPDQYGKLKPVAANVDQIVIVWAPEPLPSSQLLDRYLVAAELAGAAPVLLLNKADLLEHQHHHHCQALCQLYQQVGYPVLTVSACDGVGLAALRQTLIGHTSVLVGQSGVGKSSLVNALLPQAALAVATLSDRSGLGQHTTVTARLFPLSDGGQLIDSPGVREFGLWHIDETSLLAGYRELAPLAGHCRFRNCSHRHEPGCALRAAAEAGDIAPERLDNFYRIAETLDDTARQRYQT